MLRQSRFNPILAVSSCKIATEKEKWIHYLKLHNYSYVDLDMVPLRDLKPDIIFYQGHFIKEIPSRLAPYYYPRALICEVTYAFHSLREKWTVRSLLQDFVWQSYYENQKTKSEFLDLALYKECLLATGVPYQDVLKRNKENFVDPWKDNKKRKRIIYAPHHTIKDMHNKGLDYSTFLYYYDVILELADKYKDQIYITFKPHTLLYVHLLQYWGKERTDSYYNHWSSLENAQVEQGEYLGLLKHSDAMIHDCCSFTIEYMYMHKPCLYLERNSHHTDNQTELARRSYELHEHAYNKEDIEQFILRVIGGVDINKEARERFYQESLVLPNGQSACQNIISAILGDAKHG
jgi:UDP-N-acetylglucosamine 2-epimerase